VNDFYTTYDLQRSFSHELAHRIQYIVIDRKFGRKRIRPVYDTTSQCLEFERSAERLAYFICKEYFPSSHNWNHREFTTYRSKQDIQFLRQHWKDVLKDDLQNVV
jgi:uncharacterized protein YutD